MEALEDENIILPKGLLKGMELVPPTSGQGAFTWPTVSCHWFPQDLKVMLSLGQSAPSPLSTGEPGAAGTAPPGSIQCMFNPSVSQGSPRRRRGPALQGSQAREETAARL